MSERQRSLVRLIRCEGPMAELVAGLPDGGIDAAEFVVLGPKDILNALQRYEDGLLSAEDLYMWADALEVRDDVGREEETREVVNRVMFELATPGLGTPISSESVANYRLQLKTDVEK